MTIHILNSRSNFRKEDLELLDTHKATFYEQKGTSLDTLNIQSENEEIVLGVHPSYIEGGYDGLVIERLQKIKKLKGICLSTTAYGWAPFEELSKLHIPVCNVPGKSTDSVGEYYVFMMIALLRKLPQIIKNDWRFEYSSEIVGTQAKGLRVGIVGLGKIGSKIAHLCEAYGMNISYWNRNKRDVAYPYIELDELFSTSDVVFVTVIADATTKGMINKELIDNMKKTALFLSPVDAMVFDRKHIIDKVARNELGGLGFETHRRKLSDFKGNVFAAPEVGYYTHETLAKESQIMTESLLSIVSGKPKNVVNDIE